MDDTTIDSVMESTTEDFDLFADDEPTADDYTNDFDEGFEEAEEPVENAEQSEPESAQPEQPATVLDIVYNGQPMSLSKDEAVTLAQKGMNYDKLQQRLNEAQNSREVQLINKLAQKNGLSVEALMASLEQQAEEMELTTRANKLMDESYMDIDTARRLAKAELDKEALQNQQLAEQERRNNLMRQIDAQNAENQRRRDAFAKEINEIVNANPDFKTKYPTIESMPAVMQEAIRNGESVKAAYQQVIIEEQRQTIAALTQNQKNAMASAGSATGLGNSAKADDFIRSLFGDD